MIEKILQIIVAILATINTFLIIKYSDVPKFIQIVLISVLAILIIVLVLSFL